MNPRIAVIIHCELGVMKKSNQCTHLAMGAQRNAGIGHGNFTPDAGELLGDELCHGASLAVRDGARARVLALCEGR